MASSGRAAPPMVNLWPGKRKLDEEKSNIAAGSAQQNGFGSPCFHTMMLTANADKKGTAESNTCCWLAR